MPRSKTESAKAQGRAAETEAELAAAIAKAEAAGLKTKALRQEAKEAHAELDRTRDQIAAAEHEAQATSKELGALAEALTRTRAGLDEARAHGSRVATALLALASLSALEAALEAAQAEAAASRQAAARADATLEGFEREVRLRQERMEAIGAEEGLWQKRIANAREQILTLRAREEETSADLAALENLPAEIEQRRMKLFDAIAAAERERAKAADDLALAETALKGREKALREVQERLAEAREARARSEARLEAARERRGETARAIRDQLDCTPEDCLALAGLKPGAPIPPLADVEARLLKLKGDRERLGGVNLRAEEEEAELAAQLEEMEREKADVEEAIVRLRQGISNLNREGRKRLLEAFDTVNGHFGRLFKTLFGGGTAELKLVDSDDPLEFGPRDLRLPAGQAHPGADAAVGRREGADGAGADLRRVPDQPLADLRARRGGRAARRRQCRALLPADGGDGQGDRYALPHHHPSPAHHGADEPAVRRDHGRAGREPTGLGRSRYGRAPARRELANSKAFSARQTSLTGANPKLKCRPS